MPYELHPETVADIGTREYNGFDRLAIVAHAIAHEIKLGRLMRVSAVTVEPRDLLKPAEPTPGLSHPPAPPPGLELPPPSAPAEPDRPWHKRRR